MSHFLLWNECAKGDEDYLILEHDARLIDDPKGIDFEDVLHLDAWRFEEAEGEEGVTEHAFIVKGWKTMKGAFAYIIKPHAAKKLLEAADKYGWEQNDHFINSFNVKIQIVLPEYFTFKLPNLNTSHGF
jgi:GR25 family glycosyltransferase involved in LPS biosynthesis